MSVAEFEFDPQIASSASSVSINSYHQRFTSGALVLRPPFQRKLVWNVEQQGFLIDSILRGLPVPEIYVQTNVDAEGSEVTLIVDGQQRIAACIRFIQGDLRLSGDPELNPNWRNRSFEELSSELKVRFRSFKLIERELPVGDEGLLREVFRRLNKTNEALTPQEIRHAAYTGAFIEFVELAARADQFQEIKVFSPRDYLRRLADEFVAELCLALIPDVFPNKKDGLDELFLTYEKNGIPEADLVSLTRRFGRVLAQLASISSELKRTRFRNKSDFYSLFVALSKEAERLPLSEELSGELADTLRRFSDRVAEIRAREAEGSSTDELTADSTGAQAAKYFRAVERAATDRLSRVRRDDALRSLIGPVIAGGEVRPLEPEDEQWLADIESRQLEDDLAAALEIAERTEAERVLLEDGTVAVAPRSGE